MMKAWTPTTSARPGREERPEIVRGRSADPQAALDDHEVEPEHAEHADQPELLAERREREVRVDLGDRDAAADQRQPVAKPHAEQAAAGERVQRLDDLVAGARADPRTDRARCRCASGRASNERGEHRTRRRRTATSPMTTRLIRAGRRVEQRQEHAEEQQRRTEVALDDDDRRGRWPTSRPSERGTAAAAGGAARCACPAR